MVELCPDNIPVTAEGVLVGVPDCPICFHLLQLNSMPDIGETHWHCPSCGWWKTDELIKMLMRDESTE